MLHMRDKRKIHN